MEASTFFDGRFIPVAEYDAILRLCEQKKAAAETRKKEYYLANQEKHKKYNREYHLAHKNQDRERKQKWYAAKKQHGFISLNSSFEGSASHHINNEQVIFIPWKLHNSVSHSLLKNRNMEKINTAAFLFLYQQYKQNATNKL